MNIKMNHVKGDKKGSVVLYALSTCQWCKKTKDLLEELKVDYYYIYVDMADNKELEKIKKELKKYNPAFSFPTLVLNEEDSIIGFDEEKIRERFK
jgi:glutaredoxin-like protein NrdH